MAQYSGKQGKGARKARKAQKRREAEARNAQTLPENRKAARLGPVNPDTGRRTEKSIQKFREAQNG